MRGDHRGGGPAGRPRDESGRGGVSLRSATSVSRQLVCEIIQAGLVSAEVPDRDDGKRCDSNQGDDTLIPMEIG
jgi:hypothetical protein